MAPCAFIITQRSAVDVTWNTEEASSTRTMTCRVGHEGKVGCLNCQSLALSL